VRLGGSLWGLTWMFLLLLPEERRMNEIRNGSTYASTTAAPSYPSMNRRGVLQRSDRARSARYDGPWHHILCSITSADNAPQSQRQVLSSWYYRFHRSPRIKESALVRRSELARCMMCCTGHVCFEKRDMDVERRAEQGVGELSATA